MSNPNKTWNERLQPLVRGFHQYATWLVGISWKRFFVLSVLLMILASILQQMPPFSWTMREVIEERDAPRPPKPPRSEREPIIRIEKSSGAGGEAAKGVDITIDERGVRVLTRPAAPAASAASAASAPAAPTPREIRVEVQRGGDGRDQASIRVTVPDGVSASEMREVIEEAKQAVQEALKEPITETVEGPSSSGPTIRISKVQTEDFLTDLALLWILGSVITKLTYKGQLQARAEAAQATEVAEAESLKRQLAEARMATMQAQVEPHFLFNTLASIEHLIETDPACASRMQRALIDLLRATMPTLRDGGAATTRTLGQEQAVIEPYLAILKMRMDDRLETELLIPEGLRSAECPPMVLQMLVENAIKHGLEPKLEGGALKVEAGIVDGDLQLLVADSGIGLAANWEAGNGTGLKNIRERLKLRYGALAQLSVQAREGGGTLVQVRLPYRVVSAATANDSANKPSKSAERPDDGSNPTANPMNPTHPA